MDLYPATDPGLLSSSGHCDGRPTGNQLVVRHILICVKSASRQKCCHKISVLRLLRVV